MIQVPTVATMCSKNDLGYVGCLAPRKSTSAKHERMTRLHDASWLAESNPGDALANVSCKLESSTG
jgi:hypothetical protein